MDCYGGVQDSKSRHPKLNPAPANKVRWHGELCQTNNNFMYALLRRLGHGPGGYA
jgi:hypothetical protein